MVNFRRILVAAVLAAAPVATSAAQPPSPSAPPSQGTPAAPPSQGTAKPAPQAPRTQSTVCGLAIPEPSRMPPANSGPVVFQVVPCFQKQGGFSVIDAQTYLYYIEMTRNVSSPSNNRWVPYDDKIETVILGDFKRLWATNFLDDLAVDIQDYKFANGVIGKMVVYDMEERQRVKIVDYIGSKQIEQSKIDEELKKQNMRIALDSFIDQGLIRRVAGVVRDLYAEKGYEYAEVKPEIKPVTSGTKTVNLTFHITEGPKVKIRDVEFLGNAAIGDSKLASKMKENKGPNRWVPFILRGGTFKEGKFEEDADLVVQYYRERGYVRAQVGQPQLRILEDSKDGRTRFVELQVPVTEGPRYKVGEVNFSGNNVVKSEGLRPLFKLGDGEWFNEKHIRKGFEKAREVYGSIGYFEFTGAPDYSFRDLTGNGPPSPTASAGPPPPPAAASAGSASANPAAPTAGSPVPAGTSAANGKNSNGEPIVDITMRLDEGKQYYVNRLIFLGNTTTRDNVIRREVRLLENGVFNTEALKYSVRRLNQLGYFKPLEGEAIDVQKTANADPNLPPTVDIRLKFEEQNRNQITFGAGVSQYEGFFGQLAFQTSNFLGRGETFSVSAQQGNRAKNYQVGFTEPFLFDRPITAGIDVFNNEIQYIGQFTQASRGMNTVWGFPAGAFSRFFVSYSYQAVKVKDLNPFYSQAANLANNPFLADSLLLNQNGERRISKIGPSFLFNTIDNPIFPTTGRKLSLGFELAGLGGNTKFYSTKTEGILYKALNRRTSIGLRAAFEYIDPYGKGAVPGIPAQLPIFEKLFLGGEYSIRGFDIRSVGPRDLNTGIVIGGNKSLLFNAEYLINIAGPVRLVLFADAGQVRSEGEAFMWRENVVRRTTVGALNPADALTQLYATGGFIPSYRTTDDVVGTTPAFKSSTGAEIRFFMPVLNVPFRLIFAMNPSRGNVLDNSLQPEKKFKFRFAVGTTF